MFSQAQLEQTVHDTGPGIETLSAAPRRPFSLRAAQVSDAAAIAELGAFLFKDSFGYSMPADDLITYLKDAYDAHVIASELAAPQNIFWLATSTEDIQDNAPQIYANSVVGFAQLTTGTTLACLSSLTANKIELQRLYVHSAYHGSGAARALVETIENIAKNELGHEMIWLGVWQENPKAQRFYGKMGFKKVGSKDFKMGTCVQTDDVFVKML